MSTDIAKTEKRLTPLDQAMRPLLSASANIEKLLPPGLNIGRFLMQIRVAMQKNPGLQACSPSSLVGGSAYLIPFNGQVTLVPGYRGLIDLAGRSGLVRSINCYAVFEKDHWKNRQGFTPEHIPYEPRPKEDQNPGDWYIVWARARMAGGVVESEVLRRQLKKLPLSPTANWDKLSRALDMADGAIIDGESRNMKVLDFDEEEHIEGAVEPAATNQAQSVKDKL